MWPFSFATPEPTGPKLRVRAPGSELRAGSGPGLASALRPSVPPTPGLLLLFCQFLMLLSLLLSLSYHTYCYCRCHSHHYCYPCYSCFYSPISLILVILIIRSFVLFSLLLLFRLKRVVRPALTKVVGLSALGFDRFRALRALWLGFRVRRLSDFTVLGHFLPLGFQGFRVLGFRVAGL